MTFQSANVPETRKRQMFIQLYNGRNNIQSLGSASESVVAIRGFAVWKNGEAGEALIATNSIATGIGDKNRFAFLIDVFYTSGFAINRIDRWTFTMNGDDYIINISDADILTAYNRTQFTFTTPSTIFSTFPSGSLISAEVENMLTVTLLTPSPHDLYDIYWTDIEGIISTDIPDLPVEMRSASNTFTFDGDLHEIDLQKIRYALGRSSGFTSYRITLEVLPFIPVRPPPPPPPEEISYTLLITNVKLVGDQLKGTLSINPDLPTDFGGGIHLVYQKTAPDRLAIVRDPIVFTGDGEYDLFDVLEGEHFTFYWRVIFINPSRLVRSPSYNYMRMGGVIITDPTISQEAELSDSKIYLDRLGATSLSILLINDLFNTDDISKVVIGITDSNGTSIQEKQNTVFDARIEINITGLSQETDYSLEVSIVYNDVAKTIATLKVTTLKSLSTNSSEAEKQAYSRKNFTRRNYDKEDVDLIENLPIDQWNAVVTNAIQQINNAESDQLPHDLNRFNRRGSVHNAPRSPSPTGNFVGSLSVRIAEESGAILDIDEGYA